MRRRRAAILISGRGSNMTALIAAARDPDFPVAFALVLSNQPGAAGLRSAQAAGVPTVVVDHRPHGGDRASHEAAIDAVLRDAEVDLVCLAGYMRRLEPSFVERWASRMLNIHPSLLPAFPGLDTHARALAAGAKLHGCTVHIVTPTVDSGPILAQAAIPVLPDDTEDALGARVLAQEHVLYPLAVRLFASGEDRVRAHRPSPEAAFLNPCPVLPLTGNRQPGRNMAEQTTITTREETPEAFLADRQRFWTMFTQFTTFAVAAVIIVLILLWWFLL